MSIQREFYDAPISFVCDECYEVAETQCQNFSGALAKVKSRGWAVRKDGEDWLHVCPDCRKEAT